MTTRRGVRRASIGRFPWGERCVTPASLIRKSPVGHAAEAGYLAENRGAFDQCRPLWRSSCPKPTAVVFPIHDPPSSR